MTGVEGAVEQVISDPTAGDTYIRGFFKATPDIRKGLAIACFFRGAGRELYHADVY